MFDTLIALVIRVAPLGAGLLAGLFLLALVTRAFRRDGTLNVSIMIRALLIVALATMIMFPREIFGIGVNSVALLMAFILLGLAAPSQSLNIRVLWPYLVFAILFVLATTLHVVGGGGFDEPTALKALGIGLLGSYLMAHYFKTARDLRPLFLVLLPLLTFTACLSIVQAATGNNYLVGELFSASGQESLIAFGFGSNNVLLGMSMMFGLAISTYVYLTSTRFRPVLLTSSALMIMSLVISASQAAWGGTVIMVTVMVFLTGGGARTRKLIALIFVIGIAAFLVFQLEAGGAFSSFTSLVRERSSVAARVAGTTGLSDAFGYVGGSLDGRLRYWSEASRLFETSPVWGLGFTEYADKSVYGAETHNMYLTWLTETGVLGATGFMLMMIVVVSRALKVKGQDAQSDLALHLLLSLLVGYLFVGIFWHIEVDRLFWLIFGLVGGLAGHRVVTSKTTQKSPETSTFTTPAVRGR